jgi:serine/threonine protein kinase
MDKSAYPDQAHREFVKHEVSVMKSVQHLNCVQLFEVYESKHQIILVLELVRGGELLKRIQKLKKYTEAHAAKLVNDIVSGLDYLHSKNIIHRDLKPENLLLTSTKGDGINGIVKITDFGLSTYRRLGGKNVTVTSLAGTPGFMAPEVVMGRVDQIGRKSDIWSLGIIVYLILTGNYPYTYNGNFDHLRAQLSLYLEGGPIPFKPDSIWRTITPQAKQFVQCCLDANVATRWNSNALLAHPWLVDLNSDREFIDLNESVENLNVTGVKSILALNAGIAAGLNLATNLNLNLNLKVEKSEKAKTKKSKKSSAASASNSNALQSPIIRPRMMQPQVSYPHFVDLSQGVCYKCRVVLEFPPQGGEVVCPSCLKTNRFSPK